MSCDNIPRQRPRHRKCSRGLAALLDPRLADWVRTSGRLPQRHGRPHHPGHLDREKTLLAEDFGIEDGWPVICESFKQWVLEDNFPSGRPPLEKVGVQFRARCRTLRAHEDPHPQWRPRHHRLSCWAHGHTLVHEAMAHPLVSAFLRKVETDEIVPIVPPVPDTDLNHYLALCEQRFAHPKIGDTIRRLALDGSNRPPNSSSPSALDRFGPATPCKALRWSRRSGAA